METNKRPVEINDNMLNEVTGGFEVTASKYDLGQKVRYIDHFGKETAGVITEEIFYYSEQSWIYMICDMDGNMSGSYSEEQILGTL